MKLTTHERSELRRFASSIERRFPDLAIRAMNDADLGVVSSFEYDAIFAKYRHWLVFGTIA